MISRLFRSFRRPNDLFSFLANEHTPRAEHLATWQRFQLQTLVAAWKKTFGTDIYLHYLKCFQILAKSTLEFLRHPLITVPINTFLQQDLTRGKFVQLFFCDCFVIIAISIREIIAQSPKHCKQWLDQSTWRSNGVLTSLKSHYAQYCL